MLGVDRDYQGMGLGGSLLADAIERSAMVSESIGAKALLVDPANGEAEGFYRRYGFREVPGARRLFLPLALRAPCPANESRRTDA
jgi:ribosomal protein S18 acetylase RimI-like enzyme